MKKLLNISSERSGSQELKFEPGDKSGSLGTPKSDLRLVRCAYASKSNKGRFQKVSVLHIITTLDTGGAEMMLYKLSETFNSNLISNYVVGMTELGSIGKQIQASGTPVICLGFKRGKASFSGMIKLIKILLKINPDVVQTWMYHANILGLFGAKLFTKAKVVWNIRATVRKNSEYKKLTLVALYLGRLLSRMPDAVVFNSQAGVRDHRKLGFRPKATIYIPNGFDLNLFQPNNSIRNEMRRKLSIPEKTLCVGLFGRFEPIKDFRTFFKAAWHINQQLHDIQFILCGEIGDKNRPVLKAWIDEFHLEQIMRPLGSRSDVHKIMPAMDTVVSSSKSEGFSNVIGEAMACGIPCVVTDVGDSAAIVGSTGKVVPAQNPFEMAQAVIDLLTKSQKQREALGIQARKKIETHYSLEHITKRYESLYRQMAGQTDIKEKG